jgi:hypothetical protein
VRGWACLLSGLIVWAVHFFALYIIASVFLTTPLARILVLMVTAGCLVALGALLRRTARGNSPARLESWTRAVAISGIGLSAVAIFWQALPAVML